MNRSTLRDAALVVALAAGLALAVNTLRSSAALPLVAREPYQILVPCPEQRGEVKALAPAQVLGGAGQALLVDARDAEAYRRWHLPGALSLAFDYLEPVSPDRVRELLRSGARQVIVYGDGDNPDSGEQLSRQLSGAGVRNVSYVKGGAPALQQAARRRP